MSARHESASTDGDERTPSRMIGRARVAGPGLAERWLALATVFLLAYGLPNSWFTEDNVALESGDSAVIAVFLILFGIAMTRLVGQWGHVMRAIRREPYLVAFTLFLISSTVWSTDPGLTFRRSVAIALTGLFGYYLVVRFPLREIIRLAAVALAIGTAINVVFIFGLRQYGITQVSTEIATSGDWSGVFTHKNSLGSSSMLAGIVFLFAARLFPRWRMACYALVAISVVLIIGADSKTSMVSFFLLIVLMALFTGLRANETLYGGVAVGLIGSGLLAAAFVTTNLGPITESIGRDATLTGRTQLWTDVIHEIGRRPFFGFGWSGFWSYDETGPAAYVLRRNTWNPPDAHNAVLELMLNLGIIGAALFLFVFLRGLIRAVGYVKRTPGILGLWPLVYFSLVLMRSVTEKGVVNRDLTWALFAVAVSLVGRDKSQGHLTTKAPVGTRATLADEVAPPETVADLPQPSPRPDKTVAKADAAPTAKPATKTADKATAAGPTAKPATKPADKATARPAGKKPAKAAAKPAAKSTAKATPKAVARPAGKKPAKAAAKSPAKSTANRRSAAPARESQTKPPASADSPRSSFNVKRPPT